MIIATRKRGGVELRKNLLRQLLSSMHFCHHAPSTQTQNSGVKTKKTQKTEQRIHAAATVVFTRLQHLRT